MPLRYGNVCFALESGHSALWGSSPVLFGNRGWRIGQKLLTFVNRSLKFSKIDKCDLERHRGKNGQSITCRRQVHQPPYRAEG